MRITQKLPTLLIVVLAACIAAVGITALFADWRTAGITIAATLIGLYGSYALGKDQLSATDPRRGARQAFRQVVTHYRQLGALQQMVESEGNALASVAGDDGRLAVEHVDRALYHISFQLTQQLSTANDAIANWADVLPEEVRELEAEQPHKENT